MIIAPYTPPQQARLNSVLKNLRDRGCRITPQRKAILSLVLSSPEHPTAEWIYDTVRRDYPMASLATVYNTLALLKQLGEVLEIGVFGTGSHFDGLTPNPHPHLICTECHKIIDADLPTYQEETAAAARKAGYIVVTHRFDIFGVCPDCQKSA